MHHSDLRDKLTCPLCREIYTDPVTLPCGHNYCLRCIGGTGGENMVTWGTPSCPECRWRYKIRPELRKNETLCNIAECFLLYTKPRAPPVPAVMHNSDLTDKLTCSLCREIYPSVTLLCGHNYCLRCIGGTGGENMVTWGTPSCPVCGWEYKIRPKPRKNETLCNIVEPFHLYTKPRAPPVPAVKRVSHVTCPLCQLIYTDPVTLPCSHNYCLRCIVRTWGEQRKKNESPSCPECEERYWIHPELLRNTNLGNIAQKVTLRNTFRMVVCTYCSHSAEPSAVPATKSCLHCAASLCERHVTEHSQSAEHVLTDPTRRCSAHQELLRYRCTEDGAHVCVSCCLAGGHRGHRVELLNEASEKRNSQAKLSCSICRKVYTDPVTLPCGHNYCLRCIEGTGGERGQKGASLSCPECGESTREMELSKNLTLCHIVQLLPTPPEQPDPAEPPASFGHRNCSAHGERLRYRCTEDGAPVCVSCCLAGGHRGHGVEMFPEGQE